MDLYQPPVDSDLEIGAPSHSTAGSIHPRVSMWTLKGRTWQVREPPM